MGRRLAAILAADVVGYSRLMEADEAGTLAALNVHRSALIDPLIAEHGGRTVKLMGDGTLVEFPSVVDAVACAIAIQCGMAERNSEVPEARRIRLRIGVNLGDVISEGDDIFGDGVNIAARLEALAEPGGLCVSGTVHEHVAGKLEVAFTDDGEQTVKNLSRPIQVWRWAEAVADMPTLQADEGSAPPLPDKPSIAVLPFTNMSGDADQEYFSDGITEDIITELSRFKSLFVIARNSSFSFRGQAVDVKEVGRRLGARYVVEGSVRKAGRRVRVTAQLVDATTANHLWAERYDRELEDIFAVQDELAHEIVAAIPGQLDAAASERAQRRPTENQTAYDYVLRGEWHLNDDFGSLKAREMLNKAVEIDPRCARAYIRLATSHAYGVFAHGAATEEAVERARSLAETALQVDPADPAVQATAATAYIMVGKHDWARSHIETAIKLNSNDYTVMRNAGIVTGYLGDHEVGLTWLDRLARHDPFSGDAKRESRFDILYMMRRYEEALSLFRGWRIPPPHIYAECGALYAQLGRMEEAQAAIAKMDQTRPDGFDAVQVARAHARMCGRPQDREHWLDGYRKAGLRV